MPVVLASLDHLQDLNDIFRLRFRDPLEKGVSLVLSDLQLLSVLVEQIIDGLVVYLDIAAPDFKVDLFNAFVVEDVIAVQFRLALLFLKLQLRQFLLGSHVRFMLVPYLSHLPKEIFEAPRQQTPLRFVALDRVGLATACLAVGKDAAVVAKHAADHDLLANVLKQLVLVRVFGCNVVKCEIER